MSEYDGLACIKMFPHTRHRTCYPEENVMKEIKDASSVVNYFKQIKQNGKYK